MAKITAAGPFGALMALADTEGEMHGVRAERVSSGRVSSNEAGRGETTLLVCYVDGKRSSRQLALRRLGEHINEGQKIEFEAPLSSIFKLQA